MSRVPLADVVAYLDEYLRIREVPDEPNALNGLQVENRGQVSRVVAAVDGALATVTAAEPGVLFLVHHGLFWDGNQPVRGRRLGRLRALLDADAALYSAHIPLDLHPEVGNNAQLASRIGLEVSGWFGHYRGVPLGAEGVWPAGRPLGSLVEALGKALGLAPGAVKVIAGGPPVPVRVGIITGAGGSMLAQARDAGIDTFITGEGPAHTYHDAMEWGMNLLYAGHYATETLGVQALARELQRRFDLPWEFRDLPTGL